MLINYDKQRVPLSSRQRENRKGKYRYYGAQGVIDWIDDYLFDGEYLLVAEDGENLLSKNQPIAYLVQGQFWVNNHSHILQSNQNSDIRYICYLLNAIDISAYVTGSAQPKFSQGSLNAIEIDLPDLPIQRTIANTLSALDDKIALNNRINRNLEQIAQAVFVELCSEGENAVLSDILTVCYGKDHKRLSDGEIPCYGSGGVMRYVDEAIYKDESVLIPRKGSLNNVLYINEPFWTVDTMFYTHMTHPNVAKFVYFTVRSLDLAGMNVGSAVPSMTTTVLNALEIVLPSDDALASFEESVSPMFHQIKANDEQSNRLAAIRDTLLPRLMSGEIDVREALANEKTF